LFSGDTLWVDHGEWAAVVLDPGARTSYLASLALIRELDFDVLVPWGVTQGESCVDVVTRSQMQHRLDQVIARVENGSGR
jgi:hypothetical protein